MAATPARARENAAASASHTAAAVAQRPAEQFELPAQYLETRWYAAQTRANHEKRVQDQLRERTVEAYLPVYSSMRRWKDRRVRLEMPLFPGYVFVHIALRDRLQVLQTPSVVRLVGFGGQATAVADQEMETLRQGLLQGVQMEPHRYLKVG